MNTQSFGSHCHWDPSKFLLILVDIESRDLTWAFFNRFVTPRTLLPDKIDWALMCFLPNNGAAGGR